MRVERRCEGRRGARLRCHALPAGLVAGALTCSPTARALEGADDTRALPCRPTIACTADLVQPGAFELESGVLFRKLGAGDRQWTFPVLAKLTLTNWVQAQLGGDGYTIAVGDVPTRYLDDITAGAKFHVLDQSAAIPSVSLSATASIPTFRGEGYLRTYDALFVAYVTKDFGPLHADLNLGENIWRLDGNPRPQHWVALAVSMNLPPPFGVMAEGYYFTSALPVATHDGGFLFAIDHSPRPWLVFDFGGDVGFFPSTRAYSVFVGMTIVPVLLWRHPTAVAPEHAR
jgi:hypothetical protein